MREKLPNRRASWIQKVKIDGTSYYLTCGEYADGRLGEVWIEAHKHGSFARGVLDTLARQVSVALQNGTEVSEVVKCLRDMNFPPNGNVCSSPYVTEAKSVADWVAQELEAVYVRGEQKQLNYRDDPTTLEELECSSPSPRVKLHTSESGGE